MKKILSLLSLLIPVTIFAQNLHVIQSDVSGKNYINQFPAIRQYVPAQGITSTTALTNFPFTALDSTQMYLTTVNPYPVAGTKFGGVGWAGPVGSDSVMVTAPFGILCGSSFSASHSSPWHHWSRLENPGGAAGFLYNMIDSVGTLAYYMRQQTGYRWYPNAIGGQTSGQMRARWARDVLGQVIIATLDGRGAQTLTRKPYIVFFDGIGNDPYAAGASPQNTIQNLIYMAQSCKENGIRFICSISTTTSGVSVAGDIFCQTVNKWLESGGLDPYNAVIWDMRKYWSDPAWGYDGTHGNPNYINSTDNTHFTSGQGGATAGYDSLAIAIVNTCRVPKLTQVVFNTNLAPTNPVAQWKYISAATIDGTPYTIPNNNDTLTLTVPLGNGNGTGGAAYDPGDSVWIHPTAATALTGSGNNFGVGYIAWVMDNTANYTTLDTNRLSGRRTMGSIGGISTNINPSSVIIQPENPLNTAAVLAMWNPGLTGYGFEVHPSGSGNYEIVNGNGSGLVGTEKLAVYGNVNAVNSSFIGLGTAHQLGNVNYGFNGTPALDQGFGLTNSLPAIYGLAVSTMANPIFSLVSLVPRPNITATSMHIGEIIDTIGMGNITPIDTIDKMLLRQTITDTVTARAAVILGGVEIQHSYNPATIGADRIADIWTQWGDLWLATLENGKAGIGTMSPGGAEKLDIVDTARGIRIPRLTQTQINNMGYIKSVTVTAPGSGYSTIPKISFTNTTGTLARAYATVSAGALASIVMLDGGIDYTGTVTVNVANTTGSGATFTPNVVVADTGTMVFNLTTGNYQYYNGGGWTVLGTTASTPNIFSQTSNGAALTTSTTTTNILGTGIGSATIAANSLSAGQVITIHGFAVLSTAASPGTLTLGGFVNGAGTVPAFTPPGGVSSYVVEITSSYTVITTGSSGSIQGQTVITINPGSGGTTSYSSSMTSASALNTTVTNPCVVNATWGSSVAGNSLQSVPPFTVKVQ